MMYCGEGLMEERLVESWEKVEVVPTWNLRQDVWISPEARKVRAAHRRL